MIAAGESERVRWCGFRRRRLLQVRGMSPTHRSHATTARAAARWSPSASACDQVRRWRVLRVGAACRYRSCARSTGSRGVEYEPGRCWWCGDRRGVPSPLRAARLSRGPGRAARARSSAAQAGSCGSRASAGPCRVAWQRRRLAPALPRASTGKKKAAVRAASSRRAPQAAKKVASRARR